MQKNAARVRTLEDLIKLHEGLSLKLYRCSTGRWTIGWGRNLSDNGINLREAELMLEHDIAQSQHDLHRALGPEIIATVSYNRFCALTDMVFNLGLKRFLEFKKMIDAIKEGDWDKVADEALDSKWADQVKGRALRDAKLLREG